MVEESERSFIATKRAIEEAPIGIEVAAAILKPASLSSMAGAVTAAVPDILSLDITHKTQFNLGTLTGITEMQDPDVSPKINTVIIDYLAHSDVSLDDLIELQGVMKAALPSGNDDSINYNEVWPVGDGTYFDDCGLSC